VLGGKQSGFEDFVTRPNRKAYKLYSMLRTRVIIGVDKFDRPILVERVGDFFSNDSASKALPPKLWCLCFSYDLAMLMHASRESSIKAKRLIHKIAYIGDQRNTSLWGAMKNLGFLRMLAKEVETHFPEILDSACLPFASSFAEGVWNLVKKNFLIRKLQKKLFLQVDYHLKLWIELLVLISYQKNGVELLILM